MLTSLQALDLARIPALGKAGQLAVLQPLLGCLETLSLLWGGLKKVPPQLSSLTSLTELNLCGNEKLKGGWTHLAALPNLSKLAMGVCGFDEPPPAIKRLASQLPGFQLFT